MLPDDPRHGTTRGYAAGCHDSCCRSAAMLYNKVRQIYIARTGRGFSVDAGPSARRIQALMAIGWSADALAVELGWGHRNDVNRIRSCKWLERKTAAAISDAYDRLCMTPGPSSTTRSRAARAGWLPPLAYDDIATDLRADSKVDKDCFIENEAEDVDDVLVERILAGDFALARRANPAERRAVHSRWKSSAAELDRLTGWNIHRDLRREAA